MWQNKIIKVFYYSSVFILTSLSVEFDRKEILAFDGIKLYCNSQLDSSEWIDR